MGKNLLTDHLTWAYETKSPVRLVMATTKDKRLVDKGTARELPKSFNPRDDLVGTVTNFDGNTYVIKFESATKGDKVSLEAPEEETAETKVH